MMGHEFPLNIDMKNNVHVSQLPKEKIDLLHSIKTKVDETITRICSRPPLEQVLKEIRKTAGSKQ